MPLPADLRAEFGLKQATCVEILMLEEDGPAQSAGLWIEDVLIGYAGRSVASVDDLHRHLTQLPVGEPQEVELIREGRRVVRRVTPGEYPTRE